MTDPTKYSNPWVNYLIGVITSIVGLLVSQSLIDNRWEKLTTGMASVLLPFAFVVGATIWGALHKHGQLLVQAAQIRARAASVTELTPNAPPR